MTVCKGINSRKEKHQPYYSAFLTQHSDIHYPEDILCIHQTVQA